LCNVAKVDVQKLPKVATSADRTLDRRVPSLFVAFEPSDEPCVDNMSVTVPIKVPLCHAALLSPGPRFSPASGTCPRLRRMQAKILGFGSSVEREPTKLCANLGVPTLEPCFAAPVAQAARVAGSSSLGQNPLQALSTVRTIGYLEKGIPTPMARGRST